MKTKTMYKIIAGFVILSFVITGMFLLFLPDTMPMHYNFSGEVDRYGSKYENLIICGVNLIMGVFFIAAAHFMKAKTPSGVKAILICGISLTAFFCILQTVILAIGMKNAAGVPYLPSEDWFSKILAALMGLILIILGNYMPKVERNSLFGLRTSWSMKNDEVWRRCQRFGGYSMIICGIIWIMLALFLSGMPLIAAAMGVLIISLPVDIVATYRISKNTSRT